MNGLPDREPKVGEVRGRVEAYIALRRGLGYRSRAPERLLRGFAEALDAAGHHGPIGLEASLAWAAATSSTDPHHPSRRLTVIRGFLRHLSALDGATQVPAPGLLGPSFRRTSPHVYSEVEIADLTAAALDLDRPDRLRPHCYATLFGLLACTGLRIAEALALSIDDVDLTAGMLTVRAGKRGRTRWVPLHPTTLAPLRHYAAGRARYAGTAFFRTDGWAGPPRAAPDCRASTTCVTGSSCGGSRPGTPTASTSTPRSPPWPPTSDTSKSATCTGTCPPSPN